MNSAKKIEAEEINQFRKYDFFPASAQQKIT
jgi:hypothetical protein